MGVKKEDDQRTVTDISQTLKDAENSLRDFIASRLRDKFGENWIEKCGVTQDRLAKWKQRKVEETTRQETGVIEERLIYYADFYDLHTILKKQWSLFSDALGNSKMFDVYLSELERLRDPDAHRRELLPHQKNLAIGISGEIRNRIVRYRSKQEKVEDCFPRIESVRDSLGNIWTPEHSIKMVITHMSLRPGDRIDFLITARDPEDLQLEYGIQGKGKLHWQDKSELQFLITENHIQEGFSVALAIRSPRNWHASENYDDTIMFIYDVLPRK